MKKILSKVNLSDIGTVFKPAMGLGDTLLSGVSSAFDKVTGTFDTGYGLLSAMIGDIPFFGSTATSEVYDNTRIDEKHYFLVPDELSDQGYSLYVMRCLPAGVPPINELPKRRLLHLPNEDALPMLQQIVTDQAGNQARSDATSDNFVSTNLNSLINEIDNVDNKVFGGVLLVGGLVALVNPLAGAAVAMKAMLPSVGLIVTKYGLKLASETVTNMDMAQQIRRAQKDVKKQFASSDTLALINPLLLHIQSRPSLDMWMMESERFQFKCETTEFSQRDVRRLTDLTQQVLSDVITDPESQDYLTRISEIMRGGDV